MANVSINQTVLQPSDNAKMEKKKARMPTSGGTEVVFYCQLEFAGTLITHQMQSKLLQDILRDFFESLKLRVESTIVN